VSSEHWSNVPLQHLLVSFKGFRRNFWFGVIDHPLVEKLAHGHASRLDVGTGVCFVQKPSQLALRVALGATNGVPFVALFARRISTEVQNCCPR
jgi:hypothetical protein